MAEKTIIEGDTRTPEAGYRTYEGEGIRLNPFVFRGPNSQGERLWPVTIEDIDGKTRVGWSAAEPSGVWME